MTPKPRLTGLMALALALIAPTALADDDCEAPMARWQPRAKAGRCSA